MSAGLAVLMLSENPTIAELGFLIVASLVASGYTAVVVSSREAATSRVGEGYHPGGAHPDLRSAMDPTL